MFDKKRIIAFIPARGGSKGIKGKNIRNLCGRPLISYTIEVALNSVYIDDVIVSTDSKEIARIAVQYGARIPFMRPTDLSSDKSKIIDAAIYTMNRIQENERKFDTFVLLQPTNPLRTKEDVDGAIETFFKNGERPLVSVCEAKDNPVLMRKIDSLGNMEKYLKCTSTIRRQDMDKLYHVNGCIYINQILKMNQDTSFNDNDIPYIMERSHSVDIDEEDDLWIAEMYLKKRVEKNENK